MKCEHCHEREVFGALKCRRCGKLLCATCAKQCEYVPLLCPSCSDDKNFELNIQTIERCLLEMARLYKKRNGENEDGTGSKV